MLVLTCMEALKTRVSLVFPFPFPWQWCSSPLFPLCRKLESGRQERLALKLSVCARAGDGSGMSFGSQSLFLVPPAPFLVPNVHPSAFITGRAMELALTESCCRTCSIVRKGAGCQSTWGFGTCGLVPEHNRVLSRHVKVALVCSAFCRWKDLDAEASSEFPFAFSKSPVKVLLSPCLKRKLALVVWVF